MQINLARRIQGAFNTHMARPKIHKNPRKLNLILPLEAKRQLFALASASKKSMSQVVVDFINGVAVSK